MKYLWLGMIGIADLIWIIASVISVVKLVNDNYDRRYPPEDAADVWDLIKNIAEDLPETIAFWCVALHLFVLFLVSFVMFIS